MEGFICYACGEVMDSQKLVYVWGYDMWVHKSCFDESEKGWTIGEAKILEHLKANRITVPPKNSNGWLPRDYPLAPSIR